MIPIADYFRLKRKIKEGFLDWKPVNDAGMLNFSLYHGTSTRFTDSILEHGLTQTKAPSQTEKGATLIDGLVNALSSHDRRQLIVKALEDHGAPTWMQIISADPEMKSNGISFDYTGVCCASTPDIARRYAEKCPLGERLTIIIKAIKLFKSSGLSIVDLIGVSAVESFNYYEDLLAVTENEPLLIEIRSLRAEQVRGSECGKNDQTFVLERIKRDVRSIANNPSPEALTGIFKSLNLPCEDSIEFHDDLILEKFLEHCLYLKQINLQISFASPLQIQLASL